MRDTKDQLDLTELSDEKRALLEHLLEEEGIGALQPQTIPRRENPDDSPLSFTQERLWFLNQLDPDSACYNEPKGVRLRGSLDVAALEQSIREIGMRHEVLRTTFKATEGKPVQVVQPTVNLEFTVETLENLKHNEQDAAIDQRALEAFGRPFNLTEGPLWRVKLLRLDPEDHVLLLSMHHSISDGWAVGVFFRELGALYEASSNGRAAILPEPPLQYADFAQWQRRYFDGEVLEEQLDYWKHQLSGRLPTLELPTDRPRPPVQTFRGARYYFSLPIPLSEAIKALSNRERVTPFMTLLAAYQTLLHRYTGQDDVILGSPIAGRNWPEVEELVGCFLNTLVLRTDLSGDPSFQDLLPRVREVCLGAFAHQDLPFERLVEELHVNRDASRNPLFQVMFVLQNSLTLEVPGLSLESLNLDRGAAPLDVILSLEDRDDGIGGWLEYNTDLFDRATIIRLAGHFQTLLEGIVADPQQRISTVPILTENERRQLLTDWNDTQADFPRGVCLHQMFEDQTERTPEAVAVVFENRQLSYRELNNRANQLAHYLRRHGVGPDVLAGLCVERSLEMVIGILGVLKAGGAYVPLDPGYPKERLGYMIQDSKVAVLLTQRAVVESLPGDVTRIICLDSDWKVVSKESSENPSSVTTEDHLAYVIYTSGSTGQPKGVMIPHRAICNHMHWMQRDFPLTESDGVVQKTPFSFDASVWEFFAPLFVGARLIMARPGGHLDSTYMSKLIAAEKATILQLVPSLLQILLDDKEFEKCSSLRRVFCGGEALSVQLQERFFACLGAELHNLYGPTEACIDSTYWTCRRGGCGQSVPIGRPIANMQSYVLDPLLQPVPVGIPGEVHLGGVGLARGYLNRPELTREKFVRHPFSRYAEARLYKTGDLARYLADGNIEFLGRIDHQVKLRGFRIELGEIESVLLQHPAVEEVVVVVREDRPGDQRVAAYVVSSEVERAGPSDLRSYVKARLPEYMVPSVFVLLDALPVTPNGKVDRRALPVPDSTASETGMAYVPPRDPLEFQLTKIWEKVLNIEPVGIKDNFFELGGHSLLAVRLLTQIEKMARRKLPLVTLFQAATIEQLAEILQQEEWRAPWSSLVPLQPLGSRAPFFCVHAAAGNVLFYSDLARHLGQDQPFYGLQAQGLDGDQDPYDRVEEMATHYIEEIRTVQPKGPYYLGGLSFGGTVAYEMAQQLRQRNEPVALLALFDTYGPGYPKIRLFSLIQQKTKLYLTRTRNNLASFLQLDTLERRSFIKEKTNNISRRTKTRIKKRIFKGKERLMTWAYKLYMRAGRPLPPQLRYIHVREADHVAHRVYRPRVYADRMALFRASRQPRGCRPDPYLGWRKLVAGGIEVHDVPGSHSHTLIREPHVSALVEKLKPLLDNNSTGAG